MLLDVSPVVHERGQRLAAQVADEGPVLLGVVLQLLVRADEGAVLAALVQPVRVVQLDVQPLGSGATEHLGQN